MRTTFTIPRLFRPIWIALVLLRLCLPGNGQEHSAAILSPLSTSPDIFLRTPQMKTTSPVYGQIKLVPSVKTPASPEKGWNGPWGKFQYFIIEFGYADGEQTNPNHYRFVDPTITLDGIGEKEQEGHGTTVHLFEGPFTPKNIHISLISPPTPAKANTEYKIGTINGDHSSLQWSVYCRLLSNKPAYISER